MQGCSLFMRFRNLPPGDCGAGLQPVNTVSEPNSQAGVQHVNAVSGPTSGPGVQPVYGVREPTSGGHWGSDAASLCGVRTYLQQTREQNLPPRDCGAGEQPVYVVSEPTSERLLGRRAACLCGVRIYLRETVGHESSLFMLCQNLPLRDCGAGERPVYVVSEPTSKRLWGRDAVCLCGFRTYLRETVGQRCSLFMRCQNLPPRDCGAEMQSVYAVSEPTSERLWGRDAVRLCGVRTYLRETVGQRCSLFMRCQNLPPRDCGAEMQSVYAVSEPTSERLWGRDAVRLCGVRTYLRETVGQRCSLFMRCQNLPPRDCGAEMQSVYAVSEPTSERLWGRDAVCLCGVRTYLQETVGQRCSPFMWCQNLPPRDCGAEMQSVYVVSEPTSERLWGRDAVRLCGVRTYLRETVGQRCSLFMWCQNLPPRDCGAEMQSVYVVSEPTSERLWGRDAVCLCGVRTYLRETVGQRCSPFMWCQNLPPRDCGAEMQSVYVVSEPTSERLWGRDAVRLCGVRTYLRETVGQRCSLFMWCQNLPPRDCGAEMQSVYVVSEPTSERLWGRDAVRLCGVRTYLRETVGQRCSLFMWCQILPPRDCGAEMQSVYVVSEPTSERLWGRDAVCLCGVRTYLREILGQERSLFMQFQILPPRDCWAGEQPVYVVSEPTSERLWGRDAVRLCGVRTYLRETVGQRCSLFMRCQNLPPRDCGAEMQSVYVVSEPTSERLWGRDAVCLCGVRTYLRETVGQRCSLFMRCQNLPPRDCGAEMQSVYVVSEPTSERLWGRDAVRLCGVRTYLREILGQERSLFMQFQILPPRDCWAGEQPVYVVSEPTSERLWGRDAVRLCGVRTYLRETVGQRCSLFMRCQNLPPRDCGAEMQSVYVVSEPTSERLWGRDAVRLCGVRTYLRETVGQRCSPFMWCQNLPPRDCGAEMQSVYVVSEPTSERLWGRDAVRLCGVRTYLRETVGQRCSPFMWCQNLPPRDCGAEMQSVYVVSEPTSERLWGRDAVCLCGVRTYLRETVGQRCSPFMWCQNLPPRDCGAEMQSVYVVSEPTSERLWGRDAVCLCGVRTYLRETVGQRCSPFMWCQNLPPRDCGAEMQSVYVVSEPTSERLWGRDAVCLCGVRTYLRETVGQRCSLFMWCQNLSPRDCGAEMQSVYVVSEPTSERLWGRDAVCLCGVRTYLRETVGQRCSLFMRCQNLPPRDCGAEMQSVYVVSEPTSERLWGRDAVCLCGVRTYLRETVGQRCSLFMRCQNLPPRDCGAEMQSVYVVSEPTSERLWGRDAVCLCGVRTYLRETVGQRCSLFMWCQNLPPRDCGAEMQSVYVVSEPTSERLWGRDAVCLCGVRTYLRETVGQRCSLFMRCQNLPPRDCGAEMQSVYVVSEPTSERLWGRDAVCLCGVRTYLRETVGQRCSLFMRCQNLPPRDCGAEMQSVYVVSEPTSERLWGRDAVRLCGVRTYLRETVGQRCSLFMWCQNLPPRDCGAEMQSVYVVSEPTSERLWGRDAVCLCGVRTYLRETVGQRCSLFMWCQNLPPRDCGAEMQSVYAVSEPTSERLWGRDAVCLCGVRTYLRETVGQRCSLFMWCQNLPPRDCGAEMQSVYAVSEPTSERLWGRDAVCLCGVRTYLRETVGQRCSLFMWCQNLPPRDCGAEMQSVYVVSEPTSERLWGRDAVCLCGVRTYLRETVGQRCSLFMWCQNLPPRDCGAEMQSVYAVSEPTSERLWGRDAVCLCGVRTYLRETVGQRCSPFMWCQNLPPRDCGAEMQSVYVVSEPTSERLWGRDAVCLCGVRTYLRETVGQRCSLFMWCQNLPPRDCGAEMQSVYVVSEPTSERLWGRDAVCLCGVRTYLRETVGQRCSLFMWCQNLPPRDCGAEMQSVYVVSEPTSERLWGRDAVCLCGVRTYLRETVGQRCSLFMWCQNLPPRDCGAEMQSVYVVSEPTSERLWGRDAVCLCGVRTYLRETVG